MALNVLTQKHEEHQRVNILITVISPTFEKMSNAMHYVLLGRPRRSRRRTIAESKKRAACARPRSSRGPRHQDRKYRGGHDVVQPGTPELAHTPDNPDIYSER